VLAGVRLESAAGHLRLAATDLEVSIATSVPAAVDEDGVHVVWARTLLAIIRALDSEDIELVSDGTALAIHSGESRYRLTALPSDDFPDLPSLRGATRIELDSAEFVANVERVRPAASTDQSRPVYTGVRLTIEAGELTATATDGYRLATTRCALDGADVSIDVLVPARALGELARVPAAGGSLMLGVTENLVSFTIGEWQLTARLLNGRPQGHERILAGTFVYRMPVPRIPLIRAVDRATLLADRGRRVELAFAGDSLRVQARSAETGDADEHIALGGPSPELRIGFDARFLREGLELVEGEDAQFDMNDGLLPVVLRGRRDNFAYIVAPLRVSS
jgi:DNA polymerase-3 subunit beta